MWSCLNGKPIIRTYSYSVCKWLFLWLLSLWFASIAAAKHECKCHGDNTWMLHNAYASEHGQKHNETYHYHFNHHWMVNQEMWLNKNMICGVILCENSSQQMPNNELDHRTIPTYSTWAQGPRAAPGEPMGKCNEHLQGHVSLVMGRMVWSLWPSLLSWYSYCDGHYCE